ncbi:MAG: VWA domain-containing protein [Acidobacteriota bacterium]
MRVPALFSFIFDRSRFLDGPVATVALVSPTAHCPLPTAHYPLLTADRSLTTVRVRLAMVTLLLLTAHCSLLTLQAQTPEPVETLRIDTDLVNLNVSVFNRNRFQHAIPLQQKDFAVYENGVPQEISFFASANTPFDLVLLLDLSASTHKRIEVIRKSAKRFVDAARPDDRIAVVTFTADVEVVSTMTSDRKALKERIDEIRNPTGGTNFWDALRFVLEHVLGQSRAEKRRSAVVVMSDGVDNALPDAYGEGSRTTFEKLMEIVRNSDAIILPIYLDTEQENLNSAPKSAYALARQQLAMIAAESGNQVYQARKVKDLEGVYEQVIQDLSTVYSLGYRPANRVTDASWRSITVQLIAHPELGVRARHGYYGAKNEFEK